MIQENQKDNPETLLRHYTLLKQHAARLEQTIQAQTHELATLRQRIALLQTALDYVPLPVFLKTTQGQIVLANHQAAALVQQTPEELVGKTDDDLFPHPIAHQLDVCHQHVWAARKPVESPIVPANESESSAMTVCMFPVCDEQNMVYAVGSVISDRKSSASPHIPFSIIASAHAEQYRCFCEQSCDGLVLTDDQGIIIEWGQGAEHIFGLCRAEVLGKARWDVLFQLLPPEHQTPVVYEQIKARNLAFISLCHKNEANSWAEQQIERSFQHPDGTRRVISSQMFPIQTYTGLLIGIIARDITEQQQIAHALNKSQNHFKAMFDNASVGVVLVNIDGFFVDANNRWLHMLGYTLDELIQLKTDDITHPDDMNTTRTYLQRLLRGETDSFRLEKRYIRRDGSIFWGDMSVNAIYTATKEIEAFFGIVIDITERKQAEHQREVWVARLEQLTRDISLLNEMSDFLQTCQSIDELYDIFALVARNLFHEQAGTLYMRSYSGEMFKEVVRWGAMPAGNEPFEPHICRALLQGRPYILQDPCQGICCAHIDISDTTTYLCTPLIAQEEVFGVLRISEEQTTTPQARERWRRLAVMMADHMALALSNVYLRARLQEQAVREPLTGLFNRRYLNETLNREIQRAERYQRSVSVIMLDIDHFKRFNDTYGHNGGDTLLHSLGRFLQQHIRGEDIACRYGGEEFTLILPEASLQETFRRAEQIRRGIQQLSVEHYEHLLPSITVSLGVAAFPVHGTTSTALLKMADRALYLAKAAGRNRVVTADALDSSSAD